VVPEPDKATVCVKLAPPDDRLGILLNVELSVNINEAFAAAPTGGAMYETVNWQDPPNVIVVGSDESPLEQDGRDTVNDAAEGIETAVKSDLTIHPLGDFRIQQFRLRNKRKDFEERQVQPMLL